MDNLSESWTFDGIYNNISIDWLHAYAPLFGSALLDFEINPQTVTPVGSQLFLIYPRILLLGFSER